MSQHAKDLEEKRRKLEEMRKKTELMKQNVQQTMQQPSQQTYGQKPDMQDFANQLVESDKNKAAKQQQQQQNDSVHQIKQPSHQIEHINVERSSQEIKLKKYEKLCEVSFVGEIKINTKEKYDQYTQADLDTQNQPQSPSSIQKNRDKSSDLQSAGLVKRRTESNHGPKKQLAFQQNQKELSQQDTEVILNSQNFKSFLNQTSKKVEKILDEDIDLNELIDVEVQNNEEFEKANILTSQLKLFDQHYSNKRIITSLNWSPINDLILASYSQNEEQNINDPVGVCLLWSLQLKQRPEFYCFCQSQVTATCFDPFSNSIILGGLFNGQIVLWDLRAKTTPMQRTQMAQEKHSYPIYSLNIVGTQNAHNLISVSNDGRVCIWDRKNLSVPQSKIDLQYVQKSQDISAPQFSTPAAQQQMTPNMLAAQKQQAAQLVDINPTCLAFNETDTSKFYVGSEDGNIYKSSIHGREEPIEEYYYGHDSIVTSLSVMPNIPDIPQSLQGLVISSSFDWSIKLWNPKQSQQCQWSFESNEDYVYDVAWNKQNPTLFAAVDGDGYIDLWDLGDLEAPLLHYKAGTQAINKCCWNKDGSKFLTGDTQGNVNLYNLDQRLLKFNENKVQDFEQALRIAKEQNLLN